MPSQFIGYFSVQMVTWRKQMQTLLSVSLDEKTLSIITSNQSLGEEIRSLLEKTLTVLESPGGSAEILRVNHYHTKSKGEYFKRKLENPDAGTGRPYTRERVEEMFAAHDLNEVEDLSLLERWGRNAS